MRKYTWPVVIAIVVILLLFGGAIVGLYTDWLWFSDLGYGVVFMKPLLAEIGLGLVMGVLFFAIIYGNLWYARRIAPPPSPMGLERQLIERLGNLARRGIGLVIFLGSIVVSFMVGLEAATHWQSYLLYSNAAKFHAVDPVFGKDIGFYVFKLPFIEYLYGWLFFVLVVATIASAAIHYADEAIELFGNRLQFAPKVKAHLGVLLAAMFFLKAFGYRLAMYDLLSAQGKLFDGPGYTEIQARMPAYWILIVVAVIAGLLVLINMYRRGIAFAAGGLVGLIAVSILVGAVYPAAVEQFSVLPNEKDKQSTYISRAIAATQDAFGLSAIVAKPFAADNTLTPEQIKANMPTIQNIRLWDKDHLQQAYNQIQTINQYYHFADVDVDRYWLTDRATGQKQYRQVWLAAREMDQGRLPQGAQTWVNQHLQFTHGFGVAMSPVNVTDAYGSPVFFIKDIPPVSTLGLTIDEPRTYFGELTTDYVFVKSNSPEIDYLKSQGQNATTSYQGNGGVPVGGLARKFLWAVRFQDVNVLLNENLKGGSRVLFNRDVDTRVKTALPFLKFDNDPYLVTVDGKLYWIRDGYTTTDMYPYSRHETFLDDTVNYVRNSVKVVVDAYTGRIDAYIIQKPSPDPIIETYAKIFPGVLKPISAMPASLRDHIRYPEDMFTLQTTLYARWHYSQTDPNAFYNNADLWQAPPKAELMGGQAAQAAEPMEPYYMIMRLPGGESEEFILMAPYIRAGRANMVAWMCAKCDQPDYGRLVLFQFSDQKNVYGPGQIVSKANQVPTISQQLTLWNQPGSGSTVGTGNLLVIPIESSLLYVMPVYLSSESNQIPQIKRVIVALGDNIAMEPTLAEALSDVVGAQVSAGTTLGAAPSAPTGAAPPKPNAPGVRPAPPTAPSADISGLINQASDQYDKAVEAQRNGDWAEYGRQVKALKATLDQLKAAKK